MKRYESQLKALLGALAKGFAIGLVVSIILVMFIEGGFSFSALGKGILLDLFIGSLISMFTTSSSGTQNNLVNASVNIAKGMIGSIFSVGYGWGIGMAFFILKFVFYGIIAFVLFVFAAISFPLTIVYTVIMYLIERLKGSIDDSLADILDKIVPIVAFIVTAFIVYVVIKNG